MYALKNGIPIIIHDAYRSGEQETINHIKSMMDVYVEELFSDKGLIYIKRSS